MSDPAQGATEGAPQGKARPFAFYLDAKTGEAMVYGAGFVAALLFLGTVIQWQPVLLAIAVSAAAIAFYHLPFIRKRRPAIAGNDAGLMLDGLGVIAWRGIRKARLMDRAVRSIRNAELVIELAGPLETLERREEKESPLRDLQYRSWKMRAPDVIAIRLEPLNARPEDVLDAVAGHLPFRF